MAFSLSDWLETIGLGRYVAVFEANDVDFEVLSHLSDEDLLALGLSLGHRRKLQAARWLIEEAMEQLMASGFTSYRAFPLVYRAKFLLMEGKLEQAQQAARTALSYAHDGGYRSAEASAMAVSGEIAAETGDTATAEALLSQAIALFDLLGFRSGLARALKAMAKLQGHLGYGERAEDFAGCSAHLWRDMGLASPSE